MRTKMTIAAALSGLLAAPAMAAGASSANKDEMAKLIRGQKALVSFVLWPCAKLEGAGGPAPEAIAAGQKAAHEAVLGGLKAAGVAVVKVLARSDARKDRLTYSSLLLLDCGKKDPEAALKTVPHVLAGIVFMDGRWERAIPVAKTPHEAIAKVGQVPEPYAYKVWGAMERLAAPAEQQRLRSMKELKVETMPSSGASGDFGVVKITPGEGHTLLDAFLLSGAGFRLADPAASSPADPKMAVVTGRVVDAAGDPAGDVEVNVYPTKPGPKVTKKVTMPDGSIATRTEPAGVVRARTKDDGTFEAVVPPGEVNVSAYGSAGGGGKGGIAARAGQRTDVGVLKLMKSLH